jgi:glycosyltransferase involved in cell wall biosynthesis
MSAGNKSTLLVIDSLGSGGGQRQLVNLALGLRTLGFEPTVLVYHQSQDHFLQELRAGGVPVLFQPKAYRFSLGVSLAIRRAVLRNKYVSVLSFLRAPSLYAEIGLLGIRGTRLVVSERSTFRHGYPTVQERIALHAHRAANFITVNSHHHRALITEYAPYLTERVSTIYNGYNLTRFQPKDREKRSNELHIACIGRITEGKNIANLVIALQLLRKDGIEVRVSWFGRLDEGEWTSARYERLSMLIDETGVGDAWRWVGESTSISELLPEYDCLVHASYYEGLPNAVCEAMACGLPVLASNVCDHPILVGKFGERGFLFEPSSAESIAGAIKKLYRLSESCRMSMSRRARRYAEENLSLDQMVRSYAKLLFN